MATRLFGLVLILIGMALASNAIVAGPHAFGGGLYSVIGAVGCGAFIALSGLILISPTPTEAPTLELDSRANRRRFSLRNLFAVMTFAAIFAALVCGLTSWVQNLYYAQVRTVTAVLAEYPEIDKVWIGTNDDLQLEVEAMYFSIAGQPKLSFGIEGIDGTSKSDIRQKLDAALREKRPVERPSHVYRLRRN